LYYTVYKITNTINNKIYIGVHKTNNLDDEYMGSGIHLKEDQKKYGIKNFSKEILEVFDNPQEMFQMESILVNKEFVELDNTYNLNIGGYGGWDYINNFVLTKEDRIASGNPEVFFKILEEYGSIWNYVRTSDKYDENFLKEWGSKISKSLKENISENGFWWVGKTHSEETKIKIGAKNSIHQKGEGNSQFGTMWIYNLELQESKKIKKEELSEFENLGWLKGRKQKF